MKTTVKPSGMFPATPREQAGLISEIRRDGPRMLTEREQAIREAKAQAERNNAMTTSTPARTPDDAVRDSIANIRRITSEENLESESFSNDDLLDACIRLVQADDATRESRPDRTPPETANFCAALDAARHRADSYDHSERAIITRAITRANRSLANR